MWLHLGLQKDWLIPVFFVFLSLKLIYPKRVGGRMEDICLNFLHMKKDLNYRNF